MKQKLIALIFLLLSIPALSQLKPKVAISYNFTDNVMVSSKSYTEIGNTYVNKCSYSLPNTVVSTGLEYIHGKLSVYYDTRIWVRFMKDDHSFSPEEARFELGVKYHLTDKIVISANHVCWHPLQSDGLSHNAIYGGNEGISISYGY
jgi:hypothetical protein